MKENKVQQISHKLINIVVFVVTKLVIYIRALTKCTLF